jgi:hypothetical protein
LNNGNYFHASKQFKISSSFASKKGLKIPKATGAGLTKGKDQPPKIPLPNQKNCENISEKPIGNNSK